MTVDELKKNLDYFRQQEVWDWEHSKVLSTVYAPLLCLNGEACVFDFANGRLISFNDSLEVDSDHAISFHKDPDWVEEILCDDSTGDVYALYQNGPTSSIRYFDHKTRTVDQKISLPGKGHIRELKIRNGMAWFIDKDLSEQGIYRLYSIPIGTTIN